MSFVSNSDSSSICRPIQAAMSRRAFLQTENTFPNKLSKCKTENYETEAIALHGACRCHAVALLLCHPHLGGGLSRGEKIEKMGTYKYAKSKQAYLFWGLMSIGHTRVIMHADGNCKIRIRHGFFDAFVTTITGGVFSVQTIMVNAL